MKKYFKTVFIFFLAAFLAMLPDHMQEIAETVHTAVDSETGEKNEIYGTVLGDSIAGGYSADKDVRIECYGSIVIKQKAQEADSLCEIRNYAGNGLDTEELNAEVLTRREVLRDLEKSDIILISAGSNDLLKQFTTVIGRILGKEKELAGTDQALEELRVQAGKNPSLFFRVIAALENWDYRAFEEAWTGMMDRVAGVKRDEAKIVVNNIYNPSENMDLPEPLKRAAAGMIRDMNDIIKSYARDYGYSVADLETSDVSEHVQSDGVHPDQTGQEIIAKIVYNCL